MPVETQSGWNSFARTNASDRWRKQSAMMGTPLTELVAREARVEAGMRVLDVACGTGEPAISIAALLNGAGEVVAADISAEPLKIGQGRAAERGLKNLRFEVADVHGLPFGDNEFDRVTCRLGLMFFSDLPKALREIHRVLKPGGEFVAAAWGPLQQPYFQTTIVTVMNACPEIELPNSAKAMFKFGEPGTLARELRNTGFSEAQDEIREVEWNWAGPPEDVWAYFQAVTVPFSPIFKAIPKDRRDDVDRAVVAAMRRYDDGQCLRFGGRFILSRARK